MKLYLAFLSFLIIASTSLYAKPKDEKPSVFTLDPHLLASNKSRIAAGDAELVPAYKALIKEAEKAMNFAPVSVMENNTPPSGDKHDFMSLAPYHWPDPPSQTVCHICVKMVKQIPK